MKLIFSLLLSLTMIVASSSSSSSKEKSLPPAKYWPHRPVYVRPSHDTEVQGRGVDENEALPLGIPFEFETPIFKGKMLLRLRHAKSDEPKNHDTYFHGRKRLMQTVIQGQFKKPVNMSNVFVGSIFQKPLPGAPPPFFARMMDAIIKRVAPGVMIDLNSEQPKVLALYAGTAQAISIDRPGMEPDVASKDIPENMTALFGNAFKSIQARKKKLSQPDKASKYMFDTDHVYTFHTYDDAVDYATYSMHLPMYGQYNFSNTLGGQPMSLTAVTGDGETIFSFEIWHESILPQTN